jgi:hypothetical protein
MSSELLYGVDEWLIALVMLALLLLATEGGFRAGRKVRSRLDEGAKSQVGTISGAVLGLLALLLGFTFSMALSRFDNRKQLVVEESNAIGTAHLRSRLLPEPVRTEVGDLLRSYVDARLDFFRAGIDKDRLREAYDKTEQLQTQLWSQAAAAVEKDDRETTTGYFITSVNEVIDLHATRRAATENHVPEGVLLLLLIIALVALAALGYGCGLDGCRHFLSTTMMSVLIVLVITVTIDLDRPRRGLIHVSQASMVHLREDLHKSAP